MARQKTLFQCQSCGYSSPKWLGKCPDCGKWNSFTEEQRVTKLKSQSVAEPVALPDITASHGSRISTGIRELDRTLGGGVVLGSVVLIGGDPGIGKSTLTLQSLKGLTKLGNGFSQWPSIRNMISMVSKRATCVLLAVTSEIASVPEDASGTMSSAARAGLSSLARTITTRLGKTPRTQKRTTLVRCRFIRSSPRTLPSHRSSLTLDNSTALVDPKRKLGPKYASHIAAQGEVFLWSVRAGGVS